MRRILITGISGFVGSHLAERYLDVGGVELYGIVRRRSRMDNLSDEVLKQVELVVCDLMDSYSVEAVIREVRPDVIHHLAAQSDVGLSYKLAVETLNTNIMGSLSVLEAVRRYSPASLLHVASSSEVYGKPEELPITERTLPNPVSPYGVSKLAMDRLALQYLSSYGVRVLVTRGFNHTGPRRGEQFAESTFAKQIALAEAGVGPFVIRVGNLSARRDYTDVRDMCEAYRIAADTELVGGPFNIASGSSISMEEVLDKLVKQTSSEFQIEVDTTRLRPSDIPDLVGDSTRFRNVVQWSPAFLLEQTLVDLLDYWRGRVRNGLVRAL